MGQRALAAALLAGGRTELLGLSPSNDVDAATEVVSALGARVEVLPESLVVYAPAQLTTAQLNCGEAGLCVRMFAPIAALAGGSVRLTGEGSLLKRPITMIEQPLRQLGLRVESQQGFLPVELQGRLQGGQAEVDGATSSQFLTGLLMALPVCPNDSVLTVHELRSRPYIDMTLQLLADFGIQVHNHQYQSFEVPGRQRYQARSYAVEGDWSGASCLLVAGAIAGKVELRNLRPDSAQADRALLQALRDAGALVQLHADSCTVEKRELKAFEFDATDCPDLFPALVALAAYCQGTTLLHGALRLTHKESNRALALQTEFGKMGIDIVLDGDRMYVSGAPVRGAQVSAHNDHRIAMACATAALGADGPVLIDQAEAVAKSYPHFFDHLAQLAPNSQASVLA